MSKKITKELLKPQKLISESGGHKVELEILPKLGATLSSLKIDGNEFIYFSEENLLNENTFSGSFVMFPTPCRLTESKYTFEGQEIRQKKYGEDVFIHGLVRDEPFKVKKDGNSLVCTIEINKKHPAYEGYPFLCNLCVTYTAIERGLEIKFRYQNKGDTNSPFGFGFHPFWRIPNKRKDVFIQVPCEYALELVNLIPTGNTLPVKGTALDLRKFKSLEGVNIDNAFLGRDYNSEQAIQFHDLGIKLTLESSEIFEHMIAYAPGDKPFFCMENLTCCPDAPNVFAKGKKEVSGLKIVSPGQILEGSVRYLVTDL